MKTRNVIENLVSLEAHMPVSTRRRGRLNEKVWNTRMRSVHGYGPAYMDNTLFQRVLDDCARANCWEYVFAPVAQESDPWVGFCSCCGDTYCEGECDVDDSCWEFSNLVEHLSRSGHYNLPLAYLGEVPPCPVCYDWEEVEWELEGECPACRALLVLG